MDRTITAMFDTRAEAEQAAHALRQMGAQDVRIRATEGTAAPGARPEEDRGILAAIADLFVPDDDRNTYGEGLRRGHVLVSAEVPEAQLDSAMDMMEAAGAFDLDTRAEEWRGSGWVSTTPRGAAGTSLTGTTPLSGGLAEKADAEGEDRDDPRQRGANLGSADADMAAGMGRTTGTPTSAGAMGRVDGDGGTARPPGRARVRSYATRAPGVTAGDVDSDSAANDPTRSSGRGAA